MSTFSYAQAAKGVSGTPTPSKTPSESDKIDSKPEEQTAVEATTDDAPAPAESEPAQKTEVVTEENKDDDFTTVTSKHAAKTKAIQSRTSSPSVRTGSKSRKSKEDDSNTSNGNADATAEKQVSSEGQTEKAEGSAEKSTEKSEDSEKTASPPKELKAAPLPSVNIWQQRREAQDAKVKAVPKSASASKPASKAASTVDETQQDSKTGSKKKGADGTQEGAKDRKKTDGKGRDAGSVPPVEDATAWPTPQVAVGEEKKKVQEKTDKSPVIRPHGKEKWTPVPYVPTAVFNTPLPSAGGRGGRRATRGGRDSGRGAHGNGAAADKAASGQAAQGAKPTSGDRGRHESGTGRAASLPAQSRRSPSADASAAADARKASQAPERGRGARNGEENTKQVNGGENVPRSQREGKAFGRNQDARAGDRNQKGGNLAVDSQAAARANDRRFEAGSKSADATGFNEFNRERGEFRSERGGRGSNRGRGGAYSNFGGQNAQFNASMSNSFGGPKFGFNDRQRSQQHGLPNGSQQGNRMPLRSPSLPTPANMYGVVYPFPGDINTMYGYPAAPMNAVPYQQQYVEPFSLMNMLSMQLEYYFSVDNMCKDMFLRKQMDSQGFVPLNVLASFKRVKSLTEDFELLRHVSRQLRSVECQTGEDGVDRLRPRDKWQQWVLPVDQREPAAQHDGAAPARKTDENIPVHSHSENVINGSAPQFVPNGVAHDVKTSLSSTAPEFMPSLLPTAVNEIANVGYPWNPPVSPESSTTSFYSSSSSFPVDYSFIDTSCSARGLDSQSEPPFPSDLDPTVAPMSFDTDNSQHQMAGADWLINKSFAEAHHPAPKSNGKGRSFTETSNNVPKTFNMSHQENFDGRALPVARRYSLGMTQPYQYWSFSLTKHFNSHLYNEFRRSALDDLLTRHIDNGFIELMEFYRNCLLHRRPIPDLVMYDLVNLSQDQTSHYHTLVSNTIHETIASGKMTSKNRGKISKYFNTQHGKKAREKLS
ncbi:Winged helix-turn-helix transcription repressor DNA-binding [Penicillium cf. griseofulvum]|uniref:Winged helix-turn-helix transcription repressor DNA-binding n=1 Tax=Penicillium cf. griseofulvum TaxID=2972120 RepID=A0A9W9M1P0_9EURO|nr:Winged helix-turn-helix transcription repressor DNA-binding [Penicillium cf. griseofulvum]KAJ5429390.1 Winged helix-turn-helix transcription repressor DNA-binding [Penicillium cf. griseofulvum]